MQTAINEGTLKKPYVALVDGVLDYNTISPEVDYSKMPLTFEITGDGDIVWEATDSSNAKTIEYSKNGGEWTSITSDADTPPTISVVSGDTLQFRGDNAAYSDGSGASSFNNTTTAQFRIKGNIMSLIDSTNFSGLTTLQSAFTFALIFGCFEEPSGYRTVIDASNLVLPATTLADYCYASMFQGCTNLTTAPELPATTLAQSCYQNMFGGCTSLTTAPELPATTLADNCYQGMFYGCTNLTTAPQLPATTLADSCYSDMFWGCTSLTQAPELPVTTLANNCYFNMFGGCTSLTTAPELPATTLTSGCYLNMFSNCTSLTTAPSLPATTLAGDCYNQMFYGCSNLNYIKCLATDISANGCTFGWVSGVASSGTFVKAASTDWSSKTGNNGIPTGWTVEEE